MVYAAALPFFGKTLELEGGVFPVAPRGVGSGFDFVGRGCIAFHPCLLSAVTPRLGLLHEGTPGG